MPEPPPKHPETEDADEECRRCRASTARSGAADDSTGGPAAATGRSAPAERPSSGRMPPRGRSRGSTRERRRSSSCAQDAAEVEGRIGRVSCRPPLGLRSDAGRRPRATLASPRCRSGSSDFTVPTGTPSVSAISTWLIPNWCCRTSTVLCSSGRRRKDRSIRSDSAKSCGRVDGLVICQMDQRDLGAPPRLATFVIAGVDDHPAQPRLEPSGSRRRGSSRQARTIASWVASWARSESLRIRLASAKIRSADAPTSAAKASWSPASPARPPRRSSVSSGLDLRPASTMRTPALMARARETPPSRRIRSNFGGRWAARDRAARAGAA